MTKLRLIQCGVGGMGKTWWKNVTSQSPDFEVVAVVDIQDNALDAAGNELRLGEDRRFKSLEPALERIAADAILTVTPPLVHVEHAKLAFSRGLHVLTEKPIAHDLASAELMVELAKKAKRQLMVAQNYRYTAVIQKLKSLVADHVVGELGHGHIDFYIPADFTGTFRETMDFPLLIDMAIHHLDLVRCVTCRDVEAVTAQTFKPSWSWYEHDPGLKMLMTLSGNVPFSYSGDWSARGKATSWNGAWRLQCAEGSIHLEPDNRISVHRSERWNKNPTSEFIDIPPIEREPQSALLHQFAEAIRSGKPAETSGEHNFNSFGAVMAGIISAREHRSVNLKQVIE